MSHLGALTAHCTTGFLYFTKYTPFDAPVRSKSSCPVRSSLVAPCGVQKFHFCRRAQYATPAPTRRAKVKPLHSTLRLADERGVLVEQGKHGFLVGGRQHEDRTFHPGLLERRDRGRVGLGAKDG